jgi:hypothetical protein
VTRTAIAAPRIGLVGLVGIVGLAALTGCPGDPTNPPVLWLALDGDELHVRLVESEPRPF